jgi:hypothetical protein
VPTALTSLSFLFTDLPDTHPEACMIYFKSNQIKSKEINNRISNHQIWPPTVCDFPSKKKKKLEEKLPVENLKRKETE